jgi:uncharacterized phage protein (TIGR02218 family)
VRSIPANLVTHLALGTTTLADAILIERQDGTEFGFTTHDIDDEVDGVTYVGDPGLFVKEIATTSGMEVGNLEISTLNDGSIFPLSDVLGGLWKNADFFLFRYNFDAPEDGVIPLLAGKFGQLRVRETMVVVELNDLRRYLQHPVGAASSKTCRWRFGSTTRANGGLCHVALGPITVTGTLTGATSNRVFRDSSRTEDADYFGNGLLTFTSGPNAGQQVMIKEYAADGTFTLALPLWGTVASGHTYSAIPGCRKRRTEDCVSKWDNVLNFGGEPDRKGINNLLKPPTVTA